MTNRVFISIIITNIISFSQCFSDITWSRIPTPINVNDINVFQDIICLKNNNCYCLITKRAHTAVLKSVNSALNWRFILDENLTSQQTFPKPRTIITFNFSVPEDGYVYLTSNDGMLRRTKNNFISMDSIQIIPREYIPFERPYEEHRFRLISMADTNYGVVGSENQLYFTTDGWNTFDSLPGPIEHIPVGYHLRYPASGLFNPIYMVDSNNILVYVNIFRYYGLTSRIVKAGIAKTSNRGKNWSLFVLNDNQNHTERSYIIGNINFINNKVGWAVGHFSGDYRTCLYKTTDAGDSWTLKYEEILENQSRPTSVFFRDSLHGLVYGTSGTILSTFDGGETWHNITPDRSTNWYQGKSSPRGTFFKGKPYLTAVNDGLFLGNYNTSSVYDENIEFRLFPNPASDYITLNYKPSEGFEPSEGYRVQIFDMLGLEVAQTPSSVNNMKNTQTGASELLRIDVSHLPAGVYFIRIGNIVEKFVKY